MATQASILALEIPCTEEPGELQLMGVAAEKGSREPGMKGMMAHR